MRVGRGEEVKQDGEDDVHHLGAGDHLGHRGRRGPGLGSSAGPRPDWGTQLAAGKLSSPYLMSDSCHLAQCSPCYLSNRLTFARLWELFNREECSTRSVFIHCICGVADFLCTSLFFFIIPPDIFPKIRWLLKCFANSFDIEFEYS